MLHITIDLMFFFVYLCCADRWLKRLLRLCTIRAAEAATVANVSRCCMRCKFVMFIRTKLTRCAEAESDRLYLSKANICLLWRKEKKQQRQQRNSNIIYNNGTTEHAECVYADNNIRAKEDEKLGEWNRKQKSAIKILIMHPNRRLGRRRANNATVLAWTN